MQIENQVISLETAKRLKELGLNQETLLSWIKRTDNTWVVTSYYGCDCWVTCRGNLDGFNHEECAAFTVSELLELLPSTINTGENEIILCPDTSYHLKISKCNDSEFPYCVWYYSNKDNYTDDWQQENDTLPNCFAHMIIYLIESGFIKVQE